MRWVLFFALPFLAHASKGSPLTGPQAAWLDAYCTDPPKNTGEHRGQCIAGGAHALVPGHCVVVDQIQGHTDLYGISVPCSGIHEGAATTRLSDAEVESTLAPKATKPAPAPKSGG